MVYWVLRLKLLNRETQGWYFCFSFIANTYVTEKINELKVSFQCEI